MISEISVLRLNLLRIFYVLLFAALGAVIWPSILDPSQSWSLGRSEAISMLGALSLFSGLGLRYPLKMLPLLFFEFGWKTIWLIRIALPLWSAHRLDSATAETAAQCLPVLLFLPVMPWRYIFETYLTAPGAPWGIAAPPRNIPTR